MKALAAYQRHSLALLSFNIDSAAGNFFNVFYGIASSILGYSTFRSGYLPRVVGALWVLADPGLVIASLLWLSAPADASLFSWPRYLLCR